jgi:membrane protein required for colicin V production
MPIIDIIIVAVILVSVVVGLMRGFVKEAISIAALLIAIWAALYFGPAAGGISQSWLSSEELQRWFGRILVFAVILSVGALVGWGLSKVIRWSALSGMDRFLGSLFGAARGILLVAVAIIGGQFAGFDNDSWWSQSRLIPHFGVVVDWIKVIAPEGLDLLVPDEEAEEFPVDVPIEI